MTFVELMFFFEVKHRRMLLGGGVPGISQPPATPLERRFFVARFRGRYSMFLLSGAAGGEGHVLWHGAARPHLY